MSSTMKKRLVAVGAIAVAAGALSVVAFGGIEKNLVYYWDPAQLLEKGDAAQGATIRLGGMVQSGTVKWDAASLDLRFDVGMQPDPGGPTVAVHSKGAPPQMFREGQGVVVEGRYDGKVFHSDRVLVKHSNEYHPPEDGEQAREMYKTLVTSEN